MISRPTHEDEAPGTATAITAALATPTDGDGRALQRARAFAEPLLSGEALDTGEPVLDHADAVVQILGRIGGTPDLQACVYLVYASPFLARPREMIAKAFGEAFADVAIETNKLIQLQRQARQRSAPADAAASALDAAQTENVRKMLLAFSRDLRVVLLRLASRLQTLRYHAAVKRLPERSLAAESLQVFAPLANRLGIWQLKWELEDLAFRFLEPDTYKHIARLLDEKRVERETHVEHVRQRLERELAALGLSAQVQGRPKHIYSIVKKMRGKSLDFDQVYDLRALRVIVETVDDCYRVLAWVHAHFSPVPDEFDDYIAKPKPNGYQSLHTVVRDEQGRAFEIQIRTRAMHEHAEHGVAAHWAYKEAGTKGYAGVTAGSSYDAKIAVLRQLLAWQRDLSGLSHGLFDDSIYVLTPHAAIVELPKGATPVDFAYAVHTDLGHRCRGARVDGQMVPLNTPLANGQTVEIVAAKEGGPSRDWLNPEAGYLVSHRAKAKVRAWFNAQAAADNIARGREQVERLLQREGKTAVKLEDLALELGFETPDDLFEAVGKEALTLRAIEQLLHRAEPAPPPDELVLKKARSQPGGRPGGVLVVGVGSLMTTLARCCKPAPPDDIRGFVTRGKGVSVHRADCPDFLALARRQPGRVIEVEWSGSAPAGPHAPVYAVDVGVQAQDRQGLLRDISEAFAREKINVIGVQTQSVKGVAWMTFTVEVSDATRVSRVMAVLTDVPGVQKVWRR
ncbi:GTP pyrophosphokinase [Tepidimonas fonticaldi]|uniref:GTP pyrophosphokinase n=1 Tax=Tepidimonas fonticaldi TaxID=1101373 RepID=A0A554XP73_9BURK|nr:bifunctional (p)ppGpp synthetase/guanosine-3',5'-bis(diphosphate) 3'-pyrophosphohydrolase [Tepidimonas fonticaldi]TSE37625.1 GTP pyrophosphokinase [Tepidimonas fonticaldi]